ncbi:MAG: hypothetical protein QXW79_02440 [Thermoplasmata archaeon]
MILNAYQVYYSEATKKNCNLGFKLYDNTNKLTYFFENSIIADLLEQQEHKKAMFFGVFSHDVVLSDAFSKKSLQGHRFSFEGLSQYLKLNDGYDVISFWRSGFVGMRNFVLRSEEWHRGFVKCFQLILNKVGFNANIKKDTRFLIMQNHFVAKSVVWDDYYNNLLKPAMRVMQEDEEIKKMLFVNTGYKAHENKSHLKRQIGLDYYPMHPFICERFISTFLNERLNYKCKHW